MAVGIALASENMIMRGEEDREEEEEVVVVVVVVEEEEEEEEEEEDAEVGRNRADTYQQNVCFF